MADTKQVPLQILKDAAGVIYGALQTLDSCCVDWNEPCFKEMLREHRDVRDWLNANGVPVNEPGCSGAQSLFDAYLEAGSNG